MAASLNRGLWPIKAPAIGAFALALVACTSTPPPQPTVVPTPTSTAGTTAVPPTSTPGASPTATPETTQPASPAAQGGPQLITGSLAYTNVFFTRGVAQPEIILEDQGG